MKHRNFFTIITIAAIILFGGGVYLYYYFFRQVNAKLIETIPEDAAFLFQINDNETFLKTVKCIHSHLTPLFGLDAYPGCQFFVDQLPGKYNQVVFTGHTDGGRFSILFVCKINKHVFNPLLSKLQIDEKNYIKFEQCKIYNYGTHLKRFVFTYYQGFFLASENINLLKKSITQLKNPRNLTTNKSFEELFFLIEKNKKQNWIVLNNERYFSNFKTYMSEETNATLAEFSAHSSWAAYQVRFSGLEMSMSGYVLKYAKATLPSRNNFEVSIHSAGSECWLPYLSELGMKKFPVAKMKLFTFTLDSLDSKLYLANGIIKF